MKVLPAVTMASERCMCPPIPWKIATDIPPVRRADALKRVANCPNFEQRPDASLPGMRMRRA
ncbi:MAG: hypothetical protein JOZ76_36765 [Bradyrhizobium sp.]|nr:hypothetical protein [Bradyrhizobium sp.]